MCFRPERFTLYNSTFLLRRFVLFLEDRSATGRTRLRYCLAGIGVVFWVKCMVEQTKQNMLTDIEDGGDRSQRSSSLMRTINSAVFPSTRLLTLQTRLSAAYKGCYGIAL